MSIIVRAIISIVVVCTFHSIVFKVFNHLKIKSIRAQYPNQKYLSEVD